MPALLNPANRSETVSRLLLAAQSQIQISTQPLIHRPIQSWLSLPYRMTSSTTR